MIKRTWRRFGGGPPREFNPAPPFLSGSGGFAGKLSAAGGTCCLRGGRRRGERKLQTVGAVEFVLGGGGGGGAREKIKCFQLCEKTIRAARRSHTRLTCAAQTPAVLLRARERESKPIRLICRTAYSTCADLTRQVRAARRNGRAVLAGTLPAFFARRLIDLSFAAAAAAAKLKISRPFGMGSPLRLVCIHY